MMSREAEMLEIEDLKQQLGEAFEQGIVEGDLTQAMRIQTEIQTKITSLKERLDPFVNLHPDLKKAVEAGEAQTYQIMAGGKELKGLKARLKHQGIGISYYAGEMMKHPEFITLKQRQRFKLVSVKIKNLGITDMATTEEIYQKARKYGLELCPPEVGPELRLQYLDPLKDRWLLVGMKQISTGHGPRIFLLPHDDDGRMLDDLWVDPNYPWSPENAFVFMLPK